MKKKYHFTSDTPKYTVCFGIKEGFNISIIRHKFIPKGVYELNKFINKNYPNTKYFEKERNPDFLRFKHF